MRTLFCRPKKRGKKYQEHTTIRCIAAYKTIVFWPIKSPLETPGASENYNIEGFKGGPQLGLCYDERGTSLSDRGRISIQSVVRRTCILCM